MCVLVPRHSLIPLFLPSAFHTLCHCGSRSCLHQTAEVEDRRREEDVRGEGRNVFGKSARGFLGGGGGGGGGSKVKEKEKQKERKRER